MSARVLVAAGPSNRRTWLEAVLRREGYDAVVATTGRGVLREAYARVPALIVLGTGVSEPDEWETLDRLREASPVPVLMLLGEPESEERALLAGANDVVSGPIDDLRLLARVRSLLRRRTSA